MRLIEPKTPEYRQCLQSLLRMRFMDPLRSLRSHPDTPIQIVNEGDEPEIKGHPLNFAKYNAGDSFTLFPL